MNAVERLLAHGEQVVTFCDEIFRDRLGSAARLPDGITPAQLRAVVPLAIDHLDRMRDWDCSLALFAAGERVVARLLADGRSEVPKDVVSRKIAAEYYGMVEERRLLLDSRRLTSTLADIISESLAWGPLSKRTVALAEKLVERLRRLREWKTEIEPDEWTAKRRLLRAAIDSLAPYSQPPAVMASTLGQRGPAAKRTKKRRSNGGGRPETYPEKLCREVVAARKRDEKQAAKARRRLPPIPGWLREYCDGHNIDIRERFPPAVTGEAWSIRANRFWKAATKRLRAAETNRH